MFHPFLLSLHEKILKTEQVYHFIFYLQIMFVKFISFIFWAFFTYTSHFYAKKYFSSTSTNIFLEKVLFVTTLQVACGAILFVIMKIFNRDTKGLMIDSSVMLLGACHSYGMLMTNCSMASTTAAITHMVKMSEPLFTTIFMAILGKIKFNFKIVILLILIISTAIGSEPQSKSQGSVVGILFALASNVCYASRNIKSKYFCSETTPQGKTTMEGFALISMAGYISLIPLWIFSNILGFNNYCLLHHTTVDMGHGLLFSSFSHFLYNMISITIILATYNPVQHAVLNLGKRTTIVLVLCLSSQSPFTTLNFIFAVGCIITSIVGVNVISTTEANDNTETTDTGWKKIVLLSLVLLLTLGYIPWSNHPNKIGKRN